MSLSAKYDEFYDSDLEREQLRDVRTDRWPRDRLEAIVFVPGKGEAVMDIGCGNGLLLHQFRFRYRKLVGVEYSSRRLDQARANLHGLPFEGFLGSSEDMSEIGSETIDRIVSADTIEHVPDCYAAANEMFRVLKRGGDIVINTPNVAFLKKRFLLLCGRFPSTSQPNEGIASDLLFDGGHLHYFTYRSLRLVMERAGFRVVGALGYGALGRAHNLLPSVCSVGVQWHLRKP